MVARTRRGLVFAAVLAALVVPSGAQAVPVPTVSLTLDRRVVFAGETVVATVSAPTTCSWLIVWGAQREVRTGATASAAFVAPVVSRPTRIPLRARCFVRTVPADRAAPGAEQAPPGGPAVGQRLQVTVPVSGDASVTVTVLPPGSGVSPPGNGGVMPGAGSLPDTGGPARGLLGAGLAAVFCGAVAVRVSRRSSGRSTASSTDR